MNVVEVKNGIELTKVNDDEYECVFVYDKSIASRIFAGKIKRQSHPTKLEKTWQADDEFWTIFGADPWQCARIWQRKF